MRTSVFVLLATGLLTGCETLHVVDVKSPYFLPPVGSVVSLDRRLTIEPGTARVFLQRGEVVAKSGRDQYVPSCSFEVRKVLEERQYIEPEEFAVVRVTGPSVQEVVDLGPGPYARLGVSFGVGDSMDNSGSTMVIHGVQMTFASERQPDVMRMTCYGGLDDPSRSFPPSVAEMRTALGDYARLILPGEPEVPQD